MSHFTVAIFTKGNDEQEIVEKMKPYLEGGEDEVSEEYLSFIDRTNEIKKEYEKDSDFVLCEDGTLLEKFDERFQIKWNDEETGRVPETIDGVKYKMVKRPMKEYYKTIDEFAKDYYGYNSYMINGEEKYGYYCNEKAKYDYYLIGGRWQEMLTLKDGTKANSAKIKDVDFSLNKKRFKGAERFWELYIEKGMDNLTSEEKEEIGFVFYKPKYYTEKYKTKENYAKQSSSFNTYAVVDTDGKWYEEGEMGWFAISSATIEEENEWEISFFDKFIKNRDPEEYITILDCHI